MKIELNHVLHLANATSTLPVSSSLALGRSLSTEVVWPALVTGLVATSAMTLRDPRARKPTFEESGREEATRQVACIRNVILRFRHPHCEPADLATRPDNRENRVTARTPAPDSPLHTCTERTSCHKVTRVAWQRIVGRSPG